MVSFYIYFLARVSCRYSSLLFKYLFILKRFHTCWPWILVSTAVFERMWVFGNVIDVGGLVEYQVFVSWVALLALSMCLFSVMKYCTQASCIDCRSSGSRLWIMHACSHWGRIEAGPAGDGENISSISTFSKCCY